GGERATRARAPAPSTSASTALGSTSSSVPGTAPPTTAKTAGVLAGKTVVLDPGHNGANGSHPAEIGRLVDAVTERKPCDTAGAATNDGYPESAFTLDLSQRLRALLEAAGVRVVLTRTTDSGVGPCITERAAIGNRAKADAAV